MILVVCGCPEDLERLAFPVHACQGPLISAPCSLGGLVPCSDHKCSLEQHPADFNYLPSHLNYEEKINKFQRKTQWASFIPLALTHIKVWGSRESLILHQWFFIYPVSSNSPLPWLLSKCRGLSGTAFFSQVQTLRPQPLCSLPGHSLPQVSSSDLDLRPQRTTCGPVFVLEERGGQRSPHLVEKHKISSSEEPGPQSQPHPCSYLDNSTSPLWVSATSLSWAQDVEIQTMERVCKLKSATAHITCRINSFAQHQFSRSRRHGLETACVMTLHILQCFDLRCVLTPAGSQGGGGGRSIILFLLIS